MPIYAYTCVSCGSESECIEPFDAPKIRVCQVCDGASIRDEIQRTSFRMGKTNGHPGLEDLPPAGEWVGERP